MAKERLTYRKESRPLKLIMNCFYTYFFVESNDF